ncbi:hypothetical protein T439DRAFT_380464 [Meredithblackwellia eburnea MCA 4105]
MSTTNPNPNPAVPVPPALANETIGRHLKTQLLTALTFLKSHNAPIRLEDLAIRSGVEGLLNTDGELWEMFRSNERVDVDERVGLIRYKPDFLLSSKSDLLTLLQRYAPKGGLQVKTLRESWSGVNVAIEELEKEGKVLVTRSGGSREREGVMKAVFWDEVGERGGVRVGEEFRLLWNGLRTPVDEELANELHAAGLSSSSSTTLPTKPTTGKKGSKQKKPGQNNRKHKITNTHLEEIDLSRDFLPGMAAKGGKK